MIVDLRRGISPSENRSMKIFMESRGLALWQDKPIVKLWAVGWVTQPISCYVISRNHYMEQKKEVLPYMGSVEKYKHKAVSNILKHCLRQTNNNSNKNVDPNRSHLNYNLIDRKDPYSYYKQRLSEIPHANRKDLVTLASWVITAPKSLPKNDMPRFFQLVTQFVMKTYSIENCILGAVHLDESNPHIHLAFIPVSKITGRVCANDVLTRNHLRRFHPLLDQYLKDNGLNTKIMTGITREQGGNIPVKKLKLNRTRTVTHEHPVSYDQINILR